MPGDGDAPPSPVPIGESAPWGRATDTQAAARKCDHWQATPRIRRPRGPGPGPRAAGQDAPRPLYLPGEWPSFGHLASDASLTWPSGSAEHRHRRRPFAHRRLGPKSPKDQDDAAPTGGAGQDLRLRISKLRLAQVRSGPVRSGPVRSGPVRSSLLLGRNAKLP